MSSFPKAMSHGIGGFWVFGPGDKASEGRRREARTVVRNPARVAGDVVALLRVSGPSSSDLLRGLGVFALPHVSSAHAPRLRRG